MLKETDELGNSTISAYDKLNRAKTVKNPLGFTDRLHCDANGWLTGVMDRNGFMTRYTCDANGNVSETKDALGNKAFFEHDAMNRLSKAKLNRVDVQDFANTFEITLCEYDKRGLVTKKIGTMGLETLYVYDENGNLAQKTDADGYITVYGYEERNLAAAINYSDGRGVLFGCKADGELASMDDWNGTTSFELDLLGQIIAVNDRG
ncbi:MAG: hypothetical protein LBJ64_00315 [Deltaproteobacteria bacterium]|nr:hypothetical protein [Deltaproteobacteria bacterium]